MDRNERVIKLKVLGRPSYNKWTLHQWVLEIKDILENEYGIRLEIEVFDTIDEEPILMIEDNIILEGLPGEEGYLIEIIKHNLDKLLIKENNKAEE